MNKSKKTKAATKFAGLLLCMLLTQTAFAMENTTADGIFINESYENTTIENTTVNSVSPSEYSTYLLAGQNTYFTVSFTNFGNETLTLMPKVVALPNSQNNINQSWVTVSPENITVAPGSTQNFDIEINVPSDVESGYYQGTIAFADDFYSNYTQYVNSLQLGVSVQAQPKIGLQTSYLSDVLNAGNEHEYKIMIKNTATEDITIDPKLNTYDSSSEQIIGNDAIKISSPSIIKAGETANMSIKVNVPENSTGTYNGYIDMRVNGKANDGSNPQMNLYFNVLRQSVVPYVKTFSTTTNAPITIEVSTNNYDSAAGLRISPKYRIPAFDIGLTHNSIPVNVTFVKSVNSGSVDIGSSYPIWAIENENFYQENYNAETETYKVPGAIGNWELTILPKNVSNFGYSITIGDINSTIIETEIVDNTTVDNTTVDNTTADNTTVDNTTVDNTTVDNTTVDNTTVDNTTVDNTTVDNTTVDNTTSELIADFTASSINGKIPLTVAYTDKSTGSPISWHWNFGDGKCSTVQNPMHTYCKMGKYNVTLVVNNNENSNSITKYEYITVENK